MVEHGDDNQTPEELRGWLQEEIGRVNRSAKLRIADATGFVTAYSNGKLSANEANDKFCEYYERWGNTPLETLETTGNPDKMSDAQVVKLLDERRGNRECGGRPGVYR
jgi:hypothetical protein